MIQPSRRPTGLRPVHALVVGVTTIVCVVVAWAVLASVVGTLWFIVKLVVVIAIIGFVVRLVGRRARR